jgi:hypothetical protein
MDPNLPCRTTAGPRCCVADKCSDAALFSKATDLGKRFPGAQLASAIACQDAPVRGGVAACRKVPRTGGRGSRRWAAPSNTLLRTPESITKAKEEAPDDPQVRRALGDFYIQRGTWALAVIETQAAVDLDTTDIELRYSLAHALEFDGRYDDALAQYRWVTNHDADFAPGQLALGSLLYRAGLNDPHRYTEAKDPLEAYVKRPPTSQGSACPAGTTLPAHEGQALATMLKAEQRALTTRRCTRSRPSLRESVTTPRRWRRQGRSRPRNTSDGPDVRSPAGRPTLLRTIVSKDSTRDAPQPTTGDAPGGKTGPPTVLPRSLWTRRTPGYYYRPSGRAAPQAHALKQRGAG